jgi:hypothetical protein
VKTFDYLYLVYLYFLIFLLVLLLLYHSYLQDFYYILYLAERTPTRDEVEWAIMQGKRAGEPMTWATIVEHFALPAFTKGSPPRIRRDVLPLALKHGGVVLLRQRANAQGNKGFLYAYMAPWIDRKAHRELFVERRLENLRAEQAQDARLFDRFSGTAYSGASSTRGRLTETEARHLAHEQYDGMEAKFDAEEAQASESRAQRRAAVAHQLEANAEAIRQASSSKTRRVVRATSSSSSDSSSDDDDDGDVSDGH